ncbi:alpha/beta hydrolase [Alkalicoccobacillus porphyridii]|uniref:Alpha/beta hydrolase n=1 Tax=Alkalicoccobacillus porphyridii TaxID=2597270 RepID=A0A553ZZY9_9BACI|nr:alpha/beta hydrolase [Alkalicoccobacillus porphyridii]TSB46993.1 alpha/beta hydrolase [Alkalicoccobacillus porphyridii]
MHHEHRFIKGENTFLPTILLLHGTGGDENDLIPLAEMMAPKASILSVRGNVSENGMNRFFKRLAAGVFDEQDLAKRTEELYAFVQDAAKKYDFDANNVVAAGYSNGANIAANLLYTIKDALAGAVLFHAMQPQANVQLDQITAPVYISSGRRDTMIPAAEAEGLIQALRQVGADVTEFWTDGGHELTRAEVEEAGEWIQQFNA